MTLFGIIFRDSALWLIAAALLAIAELIAPGYFLIFLAGGAALTGITLFLLPGLPLLIQALIFAVTTAIVVAVARRRYRRGPPSADPLLNDRASRLIGTSVSVCEPIVAGIGRVRVADGVWTARGEDAPVGARMYVVGSHNGDLIVVPAAAATEA